MQINLLEIAEDVLKAALKNGGEFAEVFVERRFSSSVRSEDRKLERVISGLDCGAGIRVVIGDRTVYAYTNDLMKDPLLRIAHRVADGISESRGSYSFDFEPEIHTASAKVPPADIGTTRKVEKVKLAEDAAWAGGDDVRQVLVVYGDSVQKVAIANSLGRYVEDERIQTILAVQCVAARDGKIQTGYEPAGGSVGFELFDQEDPVALARKAAGRAILMLGADDAPTGTMPVVLSSEAGGTMIHEAVGHGFEADLVQKGLSKYAGQRDKVIGSTVVTVVDDSTLEGKRGSFAVDDEGNPAQRTVLIESGVLQDYMYDVVTARKENRASTGNGRRQSFRDKPIPRMTNTLIVSGDTDPAEILAATPNGLYVCKMGGGQVNTVNGDFVFEVSEGYLIEDGSQGRPVRGASLIGNGPEVLMKIDLVGNDLGFGIGTCGKDGQGVPVGDAQPTLRISALTVGGTST